MRSEPDRKRWRSETRRYALCPVTRSIVRRYLEWSGGSEHPSERVASEVRRAELFISFKTEVEPIARRIYDHLRARKHRAFFAPVSLPNLGESAYCRAIDDALEAASCMVVVGTRPEHFDSDWVGYEWRSFLNEIRSGRKRGGQLFTFAGGVDAGHLPFALRSQQMVRYSETAPQDSVRELYGYVGGSLGRGVR